MVFISGGLYIYVVFREGLTVHYLQGVFHKAYMVYSNIMMINLSFALLYLYMYRTSLIVRLLTSMCLLNMVPRCLDFRVRFYDIKVQLMCQFCCLESETAILMIVECSLHVC